MSICIDLISLQGISNIGNTCYANSVLQVRVNEFILRNAVQNILSKENKY